MAVIDTILKAVGLSRLTEASIPSGAGIDADDYLYRKLSGSSRDVSPLTQERVLQLASYLYESNPLARRIMELTKDFVVGDGFTVHSPIPEIQTVLDRFWTDPITNLTLTQHLKVLELGLYGEQCLPAFTSEITGHVRLGVIDPLLISDVIHDPDNSSVPIGVFTKSTAMAGTQATVKRYRIIYPGRDEELFTEQTQAIRASFTDGECFYFAVNKLTGISRGRSDLLSLIDWLDGYDRYLFDTMERAALINAFIWDVTLTGASQKKIDDWSLEHSTPPKPGTVRVHNEKEKWDATTPDLKASDGQIGARLLRNHVLGGSGTPAHFYSEAEDINKSVGAEMAAPVFRRLSVRQHLCTQMFRDLCRYQILRAIEPVPGRKGPLWEMQTVQLPGENREVPATEAFHVQPSAINPKDLQRASAVLNSVAQAVNLALISGTMQKETAVKLLAVAANEMGVDVNPHDEIRNVEQVPALESERLVREIQAHLTRLAEAMPKNGRQG